MNSGRPMPFSRGVTAALPSSGTFGTAAAAYVLAMVPNLWRDCSKRQGGGTISWVWAHCGRNCLRPFCAFGTGFLFDSSEAAEWRWCDRQRRTCPLSSELLNSNTNHHHPSSPARAKIIRPSEQQQRLQSTRRPGNSLYWHVSVPQQRYQTIPLLFYKLRLWHFIVN